MILLILENFINLLLSLLALISLIKMSPFRIAFLEEVIEGKSSLSNARYDEISRFIFSFVTHVFITLYDGDFDNDKTI